MRHWFLVSLLFTTALLSAETVKPSPKPSPQFPAVQQVVRSSGRIFSGEVLKVEHLGSQTGGPPAITRITFRVETAVRGVRQGQLVQMREWQGLWNSGERYSPGEHVMLFLYPNSKLGLTSPVGGPAIGRYRVDQSGQVLPKAPSGGPVTPIPIRVFATTVRQLAKDR